MKYEELKNDLNSHLAWVTDSGFIVNTEQMENSLFIRVWRPIGREMKYNYENSDNFTWSEVSDELYRCFLTLKNEYNFKTNYIYTIEVSVNSSGYSRNFLKEEELLGSLNIKYPIKCFAICIEI